MSLSNDTQSPQRFPLLPLRGGVLLPGQTLSIPLGRTRSVALSRSVRRGDTIGVITQREALVENPAPSDLHSVGTLAHVVRVFQRNRRQFLLVTGVDRFKLTEVETSDPYWMARGELVVSEVDAGESDLAFAKELVERLIADANGDEVESLGELLDALQRESISAANAADQLAAAIGLPTEQALAVLFTLEVGERLRLVARLAAEADARRAVQSRVKEEVQSAFSKNQREAVLREQLKAIKKELGGGGEDDDDVSKLRERIEAHGELPEDVRKVTERELTRLETLNPNQPDYNVVRNYLDWIASVPWTARASAELDLKRVGEQLDQDHYGLDDVKKRIMEHMAVLQLAGEQRGTILCLAGPPGVGKTSLGKSIAAATDRPFVRISLGGVRDEAELRGHRRTYIGSMPGRIIGAMKKAGVKNPVILLDEIDKLTRGWSGDPQAALLEILDPEQNDTFTDHYMDLPFDLSEVLFICTANQLDQLSGPLRDRLEIIQIAGYTPDEKVRIGLDHLLPSERDRHALSDDQVVVENEAMHRIVREYTREAGVRQLRRELQKICRSAALAVARKDAESVEVDPSRIEEFLGKPKFFDDVRERTAVPGVATGLAWTPVGGDILFIETTRMPGKGRMETTGSLGDVMKESARAALAYVRTNADRLGVDRELMAASDIHLHVPAGAVPKDGPSAGVTIFTALTSLLSGRKVRDDTAMTGEVTLRGRVLPVGGVKSKVLAAHRAGMTQVVLPARNRRDLDDVPESVREAMSFVFAEDMHQVLTAALEPVDASALATPDPASVPIPEEVNLTMFG